jgi:hypothetical protein
MHSRSLQLATFIPIHRLFSRGFTLVELSAVLSK